MTGQVTGQIVPSPGKRKLFPDPSIPLCKWVGYHARRLKSLDMHALKVKIKLFFPAQETERRPFASFRNGVYKDFTVSTKNKTRDIQNGLRVFFFPRFFF